MLFSNSQIIRTYYHPTILKILPIDAYNDASIIIKYLHLYSCSQIYASIIYLTLLIGFTNLGDINRYLDAFERALSSSSDDAPPPLAKTVIVFTVRGLFNKLQFAYAQFQCCQVRCVVLK